MIHASVNNCSYFCNKRYYLTLERCPGICYKVYTLGTRVHVWLLILLYEPEVYENYILFCESSLFGHWFSYTYCDMHIVVPNIQFFIN